MQMDGSFENTLKQILAFRDEREWKQFHTPRNLAAGLSIEAAELQEVLLWKTDEEVREALGQPDIASRLRAEVADVLIYALLLCEETGIDPAQAISEKLVQNAAKYPSHLAKGRATKYTELRAGVQASQP
jgi:NTP pyrophosphatase (non-canonical NTP hydrolase)